MRKARRATKDHPVLRVFAGSKVRRVQAGTAVVRKVPRANPGPRDIKATAAHRDRPVPRGPRAPKVKPVHKVWRAPRGPSAGPGPPARRGHKGPKAHKDLRAPPVRRDRSGHRATRGLSDHKV